MCILCRLTCHRSPVTRQRITRAFLTHPLPALRPQLALDDDKQYGLSIGTLKAALKSRGWKSLW